METSLVINARIPSSDAALLQALRRLSAPSDNQHAMSFGVEDASGQVYRVVRTSGLCETVRVFESARELGFDIANARTASAEQFQKVLRQRAPRPQGPARD